MNAWYALTRFVGHLFWLLTWPSRWWRARELDKGAALLDRAAQLDGIGDNARARWRATAQRWRREAERLRRNAA